MTTPTQQSFGLLIAFFVPGFTALLGVRHFSPTIDGWLAASGGGPTVAGFLYSTLASAAAGLIVSACRWFVVDNLHGCTGLRQPAWNLGQLQANVDAFALMVDNHYRFYQFYANMLLAAPFAYLSRRFAEQFNGGLLAADLAVAAVSLLLFWASRDTLRKYYERTTALLAGNRSDDRIVRLP